VVLVFHGGEGMLQSRAKKEKNSFAAMGGREETHD
jgi:hypothetical protein